MITRQFVYPRRVVRGGVRLGCGSVLLGWGACEQYTHRLETTADCSHLPCRQRTTLAMANKLDESLLDMIKQELGLVGDVDATECVEKLLKSYTDLKTQVKELKHKIKLTEREVELGATTQEIAVLEGRLAAQGKDTVIQKLQWEIEEIKRKERTLVILTPASADLWTSTTHVVQQDHLLPQ